MTREQKVTRFWARNRGGHIHPVGNGIHIITHLPLEFCNIKIDSSRLAILSSGDNRLISNIYFTINDSFRIESIIQAVLIGDSLYRVINIKCIQEGWSNAGWAGLYQIELSEIYANKNKNGQTLLK